MSDSDHRLKIGVHWCQMQLNCASLDVAPASTDASFRRYFRVQAADKSYILMDAPPAQENSQLFVDCASRLRAGGVEVPQIYYQDLAQGYLLLEDMGNQLYLQVLTADNASKLYSQAIEQLIFIQKLDADLWPPYDHPLFMQEMALFEHWYLGQHLGLELTQQEHRLLIRAFRLLAESALAQPQTVVHRDFHSRNLIWREGRAPGVLDFQDAVLGPLSYDLVSLLKDCYIAWPKTFINQMVEEYLRQYFNASSAPSPDPEQFLIWFDLMGIQRHLKAIGIFARLNHRDGKPGYLGDIPRVMQYVLDTSAGFRNLHDFRQFLLDRVIPADPSLHRVLEQNE